MTPAITQPKLTFEQYLLTPYDGRRTEFVHGEIVEVANPTARHIDIIENLGDELKAHLRSYSPTLMVKSGAGIEIPQFGNSRTPDLLICTQDQWHAIASQTKASLLEGTPPTSH